MEKVIFSAGILFFFPIGTLTFEAYGFLSVPRYMILSEPRYEKTGLRAFRPGPTQTRLYNHKRWLEA